MMMTKKNRQYDIEEVRTGWAKSSYRHIYEKLGIKEGREGGEGREEEGLYLFWT